MYDRILVPVDGSPCSDTAAVHATRLAEAMGSKVTFLFVMDTLSNFNEGLMPQIRRELEVAGRAALDRAGNAAGDACAHEGELAEGTPADVIVERAAGFDLVVMGSHGKGLWKRLTMGSVTEAVLRRTTCPLLIIRGREG